MNYILKSPFRCTLWKSYLLRTAFILKCHVFRKYHFLHIIIILVHKKKEDQLLWQYRYPSISSCCEWVDHNHTRRDFVFTNIARNGKWLTTITQGKIIFTNIARLTTITQGIVFTVPLQARLLYLDSIAVSVFVDILVESDKY